MGAQWEIKGARGVARLPGRLTLAPRPRGAAQPRRREQRVAAPMGGVHPRVQLEGRLAQDWVQGAHISGVTEA